MKNQGNLINKYADIIILFKQLNFIIILFISFNNIIFAQSSINANVVSGNNSVCSHSTNNIYSTLSVSDAIGYEWSVPMGATINSGQGSTSISVNFSEYSGDVCVSAIDRCGPGKQSCLSVHLVEPLSLQFYTITGPSELCMGSSPVSVYSVPTVPDAIAFSWAFRGCVMSPFTTYTNSFLSSSITTAFGSLPCTSEFVVSASNECGEGASSSKIYITIYGHPSDANNIAHNISGQSVVHQGDFGVGYFVPIIDNASEYIWEYTGDGFNVINGSNTNTITVNFSNTATSGVLTVKGYNSACGNGLASFDFPITVNPAP